MLEMGPTTIKVSIAVSIKIILLSLMGMPRVISMAIQNPVIFTVKTGHHSIMICSLSFYYCKHTFQSLCSCKYTKTVSSEAVNSLVTGKILHPAGPPGLASLLLLVPEATDEIITLRFIFSYNHVTFGQCLKLLTG